MQRSLLDFVGKKSANADLANKTVHASESETAPKNTKESSETTQKTLTVLERWFKLFPWLECNDEKTLMFCKTCRDAKINNKFAKDGAGNCQMSTLRKHNECREHKQAEDILRLRALKATQLMTGFQSASDEDSCIEDETDDVSQESGTTKMFRTVYRAAQSQYPNDSINDLVELQRENRVDIPFRDVSSDTVIQIQESLVHVLDDMLKDELKEVSCYGIIVDESCDIGVEKKLGMYIRYMNKHTAALSTKFLCNVQIPNGTAETIASEIVKKVRSVGLSVANLVSLGSDGASVMMGHKNGVGVKLQGEASSLVHVHCLAHRISLASSDAAKTFPYLQEMKSTILALYNHFKYSAVRYQKLKDLQEVFDEPSLKLKEPIQIRWLSIHSAIDTVRRCYQSIVGCLEEDSERQNDTKAKGLLLKLTNYKFVALLHYVNDVLEVLKDLSLKMQREDVYFGNVSSVFDTAIGELESLKMNEGGRHFKQFQSELKESEGNTLFKDMKLSMPKVDIVKICGDYIDSVQQNLEQRLRSSECTQNVLEGLCALLDPMNVKDLTGSDVKEHIENLEKQYSLSETPFIKKGMLIQEWPVLKTLMIGTYRKCTPKSLCQKVVLQHDQQLPAFSLLCQAAMCISVTSVTCERGFSIQNKLKTKSRSSLTAHNLELLIKINVGPSPKDFPYFKAVRHWNRCKRRRYGALNRVKRARLE